DRSRGFSCSSFQLQQADRLDDAAAPSPTTRQSEPRGSALRLAPQEWGFASPVSPPFVVVFGSLRRCARSRLPQMTTGLARMIIAPCAISLSWPNFPANSIISEEQARAHVLSSSSRFDKCFLLARHSQCPRQEWSCRGGETLKGQLGFRLPNKP